MNIGEILVWESTDVLLLIPVVIALVMLVRWIRRRPVFTERDWLFLFGHPREKVLSLHMWLRFAVLWVAVVLIGFVEGRGLRGGGNSYFRYPSLKNFFHNCLITNDLNATKGWLSPFKRPLAHKLA